MVNRPRLASLWLLRFVTPGYERSAFPSNGYVDPVHTSMSRARVDQLCNLSYPWTSWSWPMVILWICFQLRKFEDATAVRYFACGQLRRCRKTCPSTCCKPMQTIQFLMAPVGWFKRRQPDSRVFLSNPPAVFRVAGVSLRRCRRKRFDAALFSGPWRWHSPGTCAFAVPMLFAS